MSEAKDIEAAELVSDAVYERWPDIVPINVVIIMDALSPTNQRSLYVLNNTDCPPWSLEGMLSLVKADVRSAWEEQGWQIDSQILDGDDEVE